MASSSSSSSSSSSFSATPSKHDVFLSFRGQDTRNVFASHLHAALCQRRIVTFKDDLELGRARPISDILTAAIDESRFSIIVFSQNFAFSLDELVKIWKYQKQAGQILVPIFYRVDPSVVRDRTARYRKALLGDMRQLRRLKSLQLETLEGAVRKSSFPCWSASTRELIGHCPQSVVKELLPTKEEALQDAVKHSAVQPKASAVFLSFGGFGTRNNFDSLYDAFSKKGIHKFIENEELQKGKKRSEIFNETKESNVSVFFLHQTLASSEMEVQAIKLSLGDRPKVSPMLDVNAKNLGGFTTLDFSEIPPAGHKTDMEVRNVFQKAEPSRGKGLFDHRPPSKQNNDISIELGKPWRYSSHLQSARSEPLISKISRYNAMLLIAAALLATITFHIALRFPVELTEEMRPNESGSIIQAGKQDSVSSISHLLIFLNSIVFFTSVALITILSRDLQLNPWLLILVFSAFGAYVCIIRVNSPRDVVTVLFMGGSVLAAAFLNCLALQTKVLTYF